MGFIDLLRNLPVHIQKYANFNQTKRTDLGPNGFDSAEYERMIDEFGCAEGDGLNYAKCHYMRYCETLGIIQKGKTDKFRVLELGGSYPYGFTLMLKARFPKADIVLGQYSDVKDERVTLSNAKTGDKVSFESKSFNIETDNWPIADNTFDVVLCMEILEHLLYDPCFVYREAHRVLKSGGELIVTTPNLACWEALFNLINFKTPYRGGHYSRYGVYGRHNREYVPKEVELLGESSSFKTSLLTTKDVWESNDAKELRKIFPSSLHMRNHNIFYVGIKEERPFLPYPKELFDYEFDYDPNMHKAKIEINELSSSVMHEEPIHGKLQLHNVGQYTWQISGNDITHLGVQLLDKQGNLLDLNFRRIDMPKPLSPDESVEMVFVIDGIHKSGEYILRFDMVRENMCWFSEKANHYYADKQIKIN